MEQSIQKRFHYLNVIKVCGMFAVVILHCIATPVTYWSEFYNSAELFISFFVKNILISWAVPVFVMTSGALFLNPDKDITYGKIFKKYILRLLIVLLTFGWFFALLEVVFTEKQLNAVSFLTSFVNVIKGETWSHLWYIYVCVGLYLCVPPIRRMVHNMTDTEANILLVILFVFASVFPFVTQLSGFKTGFSIPFAGIYIFYFIVGHLILQDKIKIPMWCCLLFIGLNVVYCVVGQFIPDNTVMSGARIKYLDNNSVLSVLMSFGIFGLIKNTCNNEKENPIDSFFAPISLGVYVIHPLFINMLLKYLNVNPKNYPVWQTDVIVLFVSIIGSIVSIYVLRKIPFVRKYVL